MQPPLIRTVVDGDKVHEVEQPGFETVRPQVAYPERMPPEIADRMDKLWNNKHGPRTVNFYCLRNVFVVGEGLVFDENLQLYQESITQNDQNDIDTAFASLTAALASGAVPLMSGPALLCGKRGMFNYGHWLMEILPMAFLSRPWIRDGWKVLVPKVYPGMAQVIRDSLAGIGIGPASCVENDGRPVHFNELVLISGLSAHGHFFMPACLDPMRALRDTVAGSSAERVWVARLDASGEHRSIIGEAALCEVLASRGWSIMHPARMSLQEQIAAVKDTRHMAGVSGAGLTNAGFMAPGARLTCFTPEAMPDVFFWLLATHAGLDYRELRYPIDMQPNQSCEWHGKLRVDFDEVLRQLEA